MADSGCLRSCLDADDVRCGCTDAACGKVKKQAGETHLRRWVVYEVKPESAAAAAAGGGAGGKQNKRKKKKRRRKKKSED